MRPTNQQAVETKQFLHKLKETVVAQPAVPNAQHYRDSTRAISQALTNDLQNPTPQQSKEARQSIIDSGYPALNKIKSSMFFLSMLVLFINIICLHIDINE